MKESGEKEEDAEGGGGGEEEEEGGGGGRGGASGGGLAACSDLPDRWPHGFGLSCGAIGPGGPEPAAVPAAGRGRGGRGGPGAPARRGPRPSPSLRPPASQGWAQKLPWERGRVRMASGGGAAGLPGPAQARRSLNRESPVWGGRPGARPGTGPGSHSSGSRRTAGARMFGTLPAGPRPPRVQAGLTTAQLRG